MNSPTASWWNTWWRGSSLASSCLEIQIISSVALRVKNCPSVERVGRRFFWSTFFWLSRCLRYVVRYVCCRCSCIFYVVFVWAVDALVFLCCLCMRCLYSVDSLSMLFWSLVSLENEWLPIPIMLLIILPRMENSVEKICNL